MSGRLLPCGLSEWIHISCAYWSAEVYELTSRQHLGMLFDVHTSISRGRAMVSVMTLVMKCVSMLTVFVTIAMSSCTYVILVLILTALYCLDLTGKTI